MAMFKDDSFRPPEYQHLEHPVPEWFRAAKLGIFVHWGAYSVAAWAEPLGEFGSTEDPNSFAHNPYAEWYANTIRIDNSPARKHHDETFGAGTGYYDLLDRWHAEKFDAADLISLVKRTGAGYFVPTTKHHDGITLWPAPGSEDVNTVERGPHQDLITRFAEECRKAGLRFGVYYSGGLDWRVADHGPLVEKPAEEDRELAGRPNDGAYARYAYNQAMDLIDRYRPDVLWGDIDWPDAGKTASDHSLIKLFDHFYELVPEGVVNDRWGDTHWDFRTAEYQEAPTLGDDAWELCRGIGYSFGYNQLENERHLLSGPAAIRLFVDTVSRGGNLLLNVGLKADGSVPAAQRRTLEELGDWNRFNGIAVFGSAPAHGLARSSDEPWVRWTTRDNRLYAFIGSGGSVALDLKASDVDIERVALLDGTPVAVKAGEGGVIVELPTTDGKSTPRVVAFPLK